MSMLFDELSYEVISGIEFDIYTLFATIVLHTPVKNYDITMANLHCAEKFARYIESQRLEREQVEEEKERPIVEVLPSRPKMLDPANPADPEAKGEYPMELKEDMAGYYWLPTEEEERRKIQEGLV
jgi:hypothetical protein